MGRRDKEALRHSNARSAQIRRLGEGTWLRQSISNCATSSGKQGQRDKEVTEPAPITCKTQHPTMTLVHFVQKQRSGSMLWWNYFPRANWSWYWNREYTGKPCLWPQTEDARRSPICPPHIPPTWRRLLYDQYNLIWKTRAPVAHPGLISSLFYISYSMHY